MTDSCDEVLDWERWAREVLTDWRVPFDNHRVGLRLGITQELCDLRDERDVLAARLAGTQDLYVQACEQRDDALALLTKVSLRKSCEGTQPYICHGLATARARLAEADALIAKGLAVVHDFLPNIGRCVLQDYQRMNEFCSEAAARAGDSAIDDLKVSIAPSVAELWVCDCGWKNIDREGVCFACQKPRATSTVEASRNGK